MELLNMPGDGSDVWLDVRTVQLYLQISLTSIYKLIHQGEIPAVKLGTKTIRVNRRALENIREISPPFGTVFLSLRFEKLTAGKDGSLDFLRFLPWHGPEPPRLVGRKASCGVSLSPKRRSEMKDLENRAIINSALSGRALWLWRTCVLPRGRSSSS